MFFNKKIFILLLININFTLLANVCIDKAGEHLAGYLDKDFRELDCQLEERLQPSYCKNEPMFEYDKDLKTVMPISSEIEVDSFTFTDVIQEDSGTILPFCSQNNDCESYYFTNDTVYYRVDVNMNKDSECKLLNIDLLDPNIW